MQAYFKLNNDILNIGLTPNELKVAVYLYSCVRKDNTSVCVKQRVIASKCGISKVETVGNIICRLQRSKVETVGNIICRLQRKGVIERVSRPHKANGQLGTYIYKLKAVAAKGFFKVKRYILGKLSGVQLRMYLFICRAVTKKNDMWNSFNDIANALQIVRKKVITVINELVSLGVIRKLRVLKKDGSYSDNHYSVSDPQPQKERRDKKASPQQAANSLRTQRKLNCVCKEYKPLIASCQVLRQRLTNLYFYLSGVVP